MKRLLAVFLAAIAVAAATLPASAVDVDFSASIANTCTLTLNQGGTLALSGDTQTLGSEESGGLPAELAVLSQGANTLTVGAPTVVTAPVDYDSSGDTVAVGYTGTGGLSLISQPYTEQTTTQSIDAIPLSTLIINARVVNPAGFPAGNYTVRTVVTCS